MHLCPMSHCLCNRKIRNMKEFWLHLPWRSSDFPNWLRINLISRDYQKVEHFQETYYNKLSPFQLAWFSSLKFKLWINCSNFQIMSYIQHSTANQSTYLFFRSGLIVALLSINQYMGSLQEPINQFSLPKLLMERSLINKYYDSY